MNKQKLNLLILEDNPDDAELMVRELKKEGFVLEWKRVETEKTFRKALAEKPDFILSDYNLPSFHGMAAIKIHQALTPEIPLIIVSDMMSGDLAVECIKAGATDYVHKKQLSRLNPVVKRALNEAEAYSERKKAEEELKIHRDHLQELVKEQTSELRESEEKYRTLTENLNVGLYRDTVGPKGNFIEINPALVKIFGYKNREEVFKLNVSDLYQNPEERKNFNRQIIENGFVKDKELNLIKKDGSALIGSVSAVAIKDKNGKVKFYDGIIDDITERKRAEEELRESEEKHRTLFESKIDGLFVLDAETKKIVFANQTGAKAYGFDSAKEVVGLNPLDFVHPEDSDRTARIIEKDMFENNLQQIHEYRTITKDGREAWISAVGTRIEYQKRLAGLITIRDITEHKKAEQINLRLAEIIRNASDGIILTNPEGQIHYINPAFEKMSGYTQDELLTTDPASLIVTDDTTAIAKKIRSAVKTKGEWKGDLFCRRKNGEIYPIDTRVFAIKNIKGELVEIAAIQQDITKRQQAEEALQENEERFRTIFENTTIGLYRTTPDGRILMANPALVRMLGYSSFDELAQCGLEQQGFEAEYPRSDFKQRIKKEGQVIGMESTWLRRDGTNLFIRESAKEIRDDTGNVLYYEGTVEDITEHKKAEEDLRESEKRLSLTLESAGLGLWDQNFKTNKIIRNELWAEMLGYELKYINSNIENWKNLIHPDDINKVKDTLKDHELGKTENFKIEHRMKTKTGEWKWILNWGKIIDRDKDGSPVRALGTHLDITERKQAEEMLRESEEKYRNIVENVADVVFVLDKEGFIKYISQNIKNILGYTPEETINEHFSKYVYSDDLEKSIEGFENHKKGGKVPQEFRMLTKKGELLWVAVLGKSVKNENEIIFSGVLRDITERKQAVEKLQEKQKELDIIFDTVPAMIWSKNIEGNYLQVNRAYCEAVGLSLEKILGRTDYDLYPTDIADQYFKYDQEISNSRKPVSGIEERHLKQSEDYGWSLTTKMPRCDAKGNVVGTIGFALDITERKQAEVALHESEERYRAIVEQSNDAIYIYQGDKFLFVNDRVCEITGYTKEVLYEFNMWSLLHPDDRERIMEIGRNRAKGEKVPSIYEARIVNINGDIRQCEFSVRTISFNGEYAVMGAVRDITESRKAQDELKKYAETQKALLKEVNHRVKNNLTAILGLLGMEEARTENKDYAAFINKFKGRISGLSAIHSLLSESGWLSLNLGHLCEQVIKASISCIPNSYLINFNVSPSAILINSNQAHHLTLVINELITNSIKHGQNYKNKIHINIDLKKDKKNVIITYKDTGKGYPQELIDENFSNIGIGFELIKGIVTHSLRGELQIYNDNGAVTIIIFKLDKEIYI